MRRSREVVSTSLENTLGACRSVGRAVAHMANRLCLEARVNARLWQSVGVWRDRFPSALLALLRSLQALQQTPAQEEHAHGGQAGDSARHGRRPGSTEGGLHPENEADEKATEKIDEKPHEKPIVKAEALHFGLGGSTIWGPGG